MSTSHRYRRLIAWTLRIAAILIVGWAVHRSLRGGLVQLSRHEWQVHLGWLVAAGVIYGLALVPMGWFWHRILAALGSPAPLLPTMCGYFLGHLGKYVPGKAMSVILRVAAIRQWVPSMRIALTSALLETLTMMAVGAVLAALMAYFLLKLEFVVSAAAIGMALVAAVPTLPPVARRLALLGTRRDDNRYSAAASTVASNLSPHDIEKRLQQINFYLLGQGWCAAFLCWGLQALSLYATLRATGVSNVSLVADFPTLLAAVAFSVVAGFLSQLPAGLGVRDALLMQLLIPICGEAGALVAAVLMRLVWLLSEAVVCGILYIVVKSQSAYQ